MTGRIGAGSAEETPVGGAPRKGLLLAALLLSLGGCGGIGSEASGESGPEDGGGASALPPVEAGEVTFIVMPDIQWYSLSDETIAEADRGGRLDDFLAHFQVPGEGPETLRAMHRWILDSRERERIAFVSYVGDIVEGGGPESQELQWTEVRANIDSLHGKVPYGIAVGNHDLVASTGDTERFERFFGAERFESFEWYIDSYGNNTNSAQALEAGGDSILFLHLACNAPAEVLEWADDLLARHPGHHAFLTTHMAVGPPEGNGVGREVDLMGWTKCYGERGLDAEETWDRLYSRHPHLRAVFSGDQSAYQAGHVVREGVEGNPVHFLLSDYKLLSRDGYLRVVRYHPETGRMRVWTYSPVLDRLLDRSETVPDPGLHNFELNG